MQNRIFESLELLYLRERIIFKLFSRDGAYSIMSQPIRMTNARNLLFRENIFEQKLSLICLKSTSFLNLKVFFESQLLLCIMYIIMYIYFLDIYFIDISDRM